MNSYIKELASLLAEQALSEDDAPANAPFGKWLFGPDQTNKTAQDEKNTVPEKTFEKLLRRHYDGFSADNSELGQLFLKYVKPGLKKGSYAKYLAPPNTTVYRGMSMSVKEFSQLVKMDETELTDVKDIGRGWYLAHQGKLAPRKSNTNTMHWSTDHGQAISFATGENSDSRNILVVFTANTAPPKNNFFVNPHEAYKGYDSGPLVAYPDEKEVISVGPVHFDEISFYISINSDMPPKVSDGKEVEIYLEKIKKYLSEKLTAKNYQTKIANKLLTATDTGLAYKIEIADIIYSLYNSKEVKAILGNVNVSGDKDIFYTVNVKSTAKIIQNFISKAAKKKTPASYIKEQLKQHILEYVIMDVINNVRKIGFTHVIMTQDPEKALLYSMGFTKQEPKLYKQYE